MKELTEDVQACKLRQPGNWLCPEGQDPNFKRDHHTENKSAPASSSSSTSAPIPTAKGENGKALNNYMHLKFQYICKTSQTSIKT